MERDVINTQCVLLPHQISTHTLTWSVTNVALKNSATQAISTHTLTWSVTTYYPKYREKIKISTHTLTWSVTL